MIEIEKRLKEINDKIGRNLLEFRITHGFTRKDIASKIGISQQQLAKYELGIDKISLPKLLLLMDIFSVNIIDFLKGIEITSINTKTDNFERIDLEIARNLKEIKNKPYKEAINTLIKTLIKN